MDYSTLNELFLPFPGIYKCGHFRRQITLELQQLRTLKNSTLLLNVNPHVYGVLMARKRRMNGQLTNGAVYLQDSAKLEKAEILQVTADHLKSLHPKGKCNCMF